ncbi:MAG: hypothetical protein KC415_00055 [Anaerolineales bacterium]|nr:hypothetical protein [Anaerolineales bacterium]MCB8990166.1 hypothetical protein [Ardenticatenaceae bacterium]
MIRPFNLRDLPLVHRLSERGVSLHSESAFINQVHPLRGALFNLFVSGEFPTFVWRAEEGSGAGFIQLHLREGGQSGHILYLSATAVSDEETASPLNEDAWLTLLDQAVIEVGQRGIHSLIAEVSEIGPELPVLRRAGFAVYTRQDIWVLDNGDSEHKWIEAQPQQLLQARRAVDDWDIQLLYANTVPRLVQLVEPIPELDTGQSWVLREGNELTAYVHATRGEVATWLRFFIHPNAEGRTVEIVQAALRLYSSKEVQPVFCCVPRYQSWLQHPLEQMQFQLQGSHAVMVKHTVLHKRRPLPELTAVLESQGISATSPMIRQYYWPEDGKGNGRLPRKNR